MSDLRTAEDAFAAYEAVRDRLPAATFAATWTKAESLADVSERWDGYLLDAFGVLNVGDTPIPGAVARMADLRRSGKRLCVLTNAASYPKAEALRKYRALGFDFTDEEVVSSRDVAAEALARMPGLRRIGAISQAGDGFDDLPAGVESLIDTGGWDAVDAVLFLSGSRWDVDLQARLEVSLTRRPRPIIIANPDIVAPREDALSVEPGYWAHRLLDRVKVPVFWYGKPFGDAFDIAAARLNLPRDRLAMVGDTLHTDVLGGRAAGMGTVLVAGHGLFAGRDVRPFIRQSGIVPDVVVGTT